jgi:hypothetical protein
LIGRNCRVPTYPNRKPNKLAYTEANVHTLYVICCNNRIASSLLLAHSLCLPVPNKRDTSM